MTLSIRSRCLSWSWMALLFVPLLRCSVAAPAADGTDRFFDPGSVQTIHLQIAPKDLERLHQALPERLCVPGTFRWGDQKVEHVGIRYKGNSSTSPDPTHKRSYLVAFSEYE